MYQLAIFPYDRTNKKLISWKTDLRYGEITDVISPIGWGYDGALIDINGRSLKIKSKIEDISKACNGLWVVDNCRRINFKSCIVPVLEECVKKNWKIFWGRNYTEEEKNILMDIIPENQIVFLGRDIVKKENRGKIKEFNSPIIFWVNMFSELQSDSSLLMFYDAICKLGLKTKLVSYKKDMDMYREVCVLPDLSVNEWNNHDKIIYLNNYIKSIEQKVNPDLFLIDIPGNLLEISKKVCGDFGCGPYLFAKALLPDYTICNLPYMDTILDNYMVLGDVISRTVGIEIDCYNMITSYLDVFESENNDMFDYMSVSEEFIRKKAYGKKKMFFIFEKKDAENVRDTMIKKLEEYSNVTVI